MDHETSAMPKHYSWRGDIVLSLLEVIQAHLNTSSFRNLLILKFDTFQFRSNNSSPDVLIPVSKTVPKNQAKVPKPELAKAIQKHQTRMNE